MIEREFNIEVALELVDDPRRLLVAAGTGCHQKLTAIEAARVARLSQELARGVDVLVVGGAQLVIAGRREREPHPRRVLELAVTQQRGVDEVLAVERHADRLANSEIVPRRACDVEQQSSTHFRRTFLGPLQLRGAGP